MNHDTYDRLADWLEARRWPQKTAVWIGSVAAVYGVTLGFVASPAWFLLLAVVPAASLVLYVEWHGFQRALDRKYPLAAELECSTDVDAWNRALAEIEGM